VPEGGPENAGDGGGDEDDFDPDAPVLHGLGDPLDLHQFRPSDVKDLVPDFLDDAAGRGYAEVKIIHGKGTGTLRRTVHALLERHPRVASFRLSDGGSAWGATIVVLRPPVT
jgi:dsDNA-specific endonuclease/ATPase MutS2